MTSVWKIRPENRNLNHPAPFPLEIPLRCIYSILDKQNGLVIDPYVGSGTTGVACKFLNCDFIGIDCSNEYIDMARNRIKNFELEREKAELELNLHKVKESFRERKANNKTKNRFLNNN